MIRVGILDPRRTPAALHLESVARPDAGRGHVRLAVQAVSADEFWFRDRTAPLVPGAVAAGVVSAVGDGVTRLAVGDRVIGFGRSGGLAEEVVLPEAGVLPIPDDLDPVTATMTAAGIHASFVMADLALHRSSSSTRSVVVDDAARTFGCTMGWLLRDAGLRAIGIVAHETAAEAALAAGYDDVVVRSPDEPMTVALLRVTDGAGVSAYVDHTARMTLETAWRVLEPGGQLYRVDPLRTRLGPPSDQAARRFQELGAGWSEFDGTAALVNRYREIVPHRDAMLGALAAGRLHIPVHRVPFDEAARAVELLVDPAVAGHVAVTL